MLSPRIIIAQTMLCFGAAVLLTIALSQCDRRLGEEAAAHQERFASVRGIVFARAQP